ncbi:Ig-like domain-containing protein [Myceligenerans crystallogenes]|uniref:Ig-like domain-containing protein n=1 Tax=Myceligenerans crystallogenes TaxID=316335 RepID=A0ABP4ZBD4_9MICO
MSLASRLMGNKRAIASGSVVTLFAGGLVGLALWYDGEATADVALHDSGIWVTNESSAELGRFNFEAGTLDGIMPTNATDFDVSQDGGRVLLENTAGSEASPIDPAHLKTAGGLALPAGAQVASGEAATAVYDHDTGKLWVLPFDGARSFDEKKKPTAELGKDQRGVMTVGTDGTVWVASPATGELHKIPTSENGTAGGRTSERLGFQEDADLQVTAVGDQPVVLDRTGETLLLPGGERVELDGLAEAQLQIPSEASADVVLATRESLVKQPLGGGESLTQRASGDPAPPAQLGGCVYGAWSGTGEVMRDCPGSDSDDSQTLEGLSESAELRYRTNRDRIILNDVFGGTLWIPTEDFLKVDDWDLKWKDEDKGEESESEETVYEQVDHTVADRDQPNNPPEPKADSYGVRPGRTMVLDVLSNDVDKDGDVMTVKVAEPPAASAIRVDRVLDGKALQADVPADATDEVTFTYEVNDGREDGTATQQVTLRVRPLTENEPPVPASENSVPVLKVAQGGTARMKLLPYFKDPDGDNLVLSTATTSDSSDEVRSRPDGTIEFLDGGGATGRKIVDVTVSDGMGGLVKGTLNIDVVADDVPPIPVQDHVVTLVGEPVTVRPLRNDSDPNGEEVRLSNVGPASPAQVLPNWTAGTYRFVSDQAGSYDMTYEVSDGSQAVTGLVRVDVVEPPDDGGRPVAVSDKVLLPKGGEGLVDVLANDTDPAGGVLVAQSIDVPEDSGLTVAVLDHHVLKITENQRLEEPVIIGYTVSNGTETATGQVNVQPIPASDSLRPPEAGADEVDVHVGDTVTIPVLRNDSHPDGVPLELNRKLVEEPEQELGEAFVSQDVIRFKAGSEAGVAHAVYEVTDLNDQRDSAQVKINVRDGEKNNAPALPDVEARVLSGGTVRVEVPLDGVDPDGDHVMLSDISRAPTLGRARVTDGFIDFEASEDSVGTDTFTYNATDSRGAVGEGTIRVGVAPLPTSNQKPVAQDDRTLVRPGRTVGIDALANDSDPDGDEIGLVESLFGSAEELDPQVVEEEVVVTAPGEEGEHPFYYGIQDRYKSRAQGTITVRVSQDAPLVPPVANDDVLAIPDVVGKDSVAVDVLANDGDPDGVAAELEVSLPRETPGVKLSGDGRMTVAVTDRLQVITYTVTDMDGQESSAFVRVPADSLTPHLLPGLDPLKAISGEPLEIDLTEYVVVEAGLAPQITEESTVSAVEGSARATGPTGITYTSEDDYVGPASVSFEVTDGDGPNDPDGRKATLTLPINVQASTNQQPKIIGSPALDVPQGEEGAVDLTAYVKDPENDALTFAMKGKAEGIGAEVRGGTVTATAEAGVGKGTSQSLSFTVSDGRSDPVQGELTVNVVASTRPLAATGEDPVEGAHQGVAESVAVLDNDTNPFPETPLELTGTAVVETGDGKVAYDGDRVVVTPAESFQGVMRVKYTVQDATKDPDRNVDGLITLKVLGKPGAPRAPRIGEVRSETVVLSWDEPNNNGAPIAGYTVTSSRGDEQQCESTTCSFTGLTNDVTYTFTVRAENEVGLSEASPASQEARPDQKPEQPAPPVLKFGDKKLTVSWTNRAYSDRSAIDCVDLRISPAAADGSFLKECQQGESVVWEGLENGTSYTVEARARNEAPDPSEWSEQSAPEVPAGKPAAPAAPTATRRDGGALGGRVDVSWVEPDGNGDAPRRYHLDVLEDGTKVRTHSDITGTSYPVAGLDPARTYTFQVTAENKAGLSPVSPESNRVQPSGTPTRPGTPTASVGNNMSNQARVSWGWSGKFNGTGAFFRVVASDGTHQDTPGTETSLVFGGLTNGSQYTFTVLACNTNTIDGTEACSPPSEQSNAVVPYGPPPAPTITATGGNQSVTFTWDARSTNGRDTTVSVTGAFSDNAKSGTRTVAAGYSQTKEACVTVRDSEGQVTGPVCDSAAANPRPTPTASVSGGSYYGGCVETCRWWEISWNNAGSGTHQIACWAGDTPEVSGWHDIHTHSKRWEDSRKFTVSGNSGTVDMVEKCYMGKSYNGTAVAVYMKPSGGDPVLIGKGTWNI